jgi:hypothetical protein
MRARTVGVVGVLAIALLLVTVASAGTRSPEKSGLATATAIDNHLRSIGIDPTTVVRQSGQRNYAGPHCPGRGWNCTTATRVVQMSTAGGQNVFDCEGASNLGPGQTCMIMQNTGGRNTARCTEHSTMVTEQHCTIEQTGVRNFARVDQLLVQSGGVTQDATQTADVTQSGATQMNELQLDQDVKQDSTSAGLAQQQDVHQYVVLTQTTSGKGNNFAHVHQSQDQDATGAAAMQNQNTVVVTPADHLVIECNAAAAAASNGLVTTPNACAKFTQTSSDGNNEAHLHQMANEDEKSTASSTQRQGESGNGLGGGFEQFVTGAGSSHNHTTQHKQQRATSNGGTKDQIDPIGCCGVSQDGGIKNDENIDQKSTQTADGGIFSQNANLVGTSDSATGTCSVSHHVRENESSTNQNVSDNTPPCFLDVTTSCFSFNGEGTGGNCTTTTGPPPCTDCLAPLVTVLASLPTLGQALPPLDVTAEPSSYTLPSWYVPF